MIRNPGKKKLTGTDVRETPRALFDQLNQEFGFTLDAAASHGNALCPHYYTETGLFGPETHPGQRFQTLACGVDGLTGSWTSERVWCNPPFTMLQEFTDKAWEEQGGTDLIVMLVPANR